jgi:hypothetical protein
MFTLEGEPMNEREQYMLDALRAIASYGKEGKVALRPYMTEHNLKWDNDEDVKVWMRRIAEDAVRYAANVR